MNKVILIGRLVADPEVRYTQSDEPQAVGNYTLAVDKRFKRDGEPTADFIRCVVWGKGAEFAEKYLRKGMKIAVTGRIQTGSYENPDGKKVYTTDVVIDEQEFCEKKSDSVTGDNSNNGAAGKQNAADGFMPIPDDLEELPFA